MAEPTGGDVRSYLKAIKGYRERHGFRNVHEHPPAAATAELHRIIATRNHRDMRSRAVPPSSPPRPAGQPAISRKAKSAPQTHENRDGRVFRKDNVLKAFLRPHYTVQTVGNAALALTAVIENKPDAILIDVRMPGMDGLSLLKSLRQMGVQTPIFVMTSEWPRRTPSGVPRESTANS